MPRRERFTERTVVQRHAGRDPCGRANAIPAERGGPEPESHRRGRPPDGDVVALALAARSRNADTLERIGYRREIASTSTFSPSRSGHDLPTRHQMHTFSTRAYERGVMSARAGLFRAWAVGTVVWLGGVAFTGLQAISQNVATSRYIYVPGDPRKYEPYNPRPDVDDGTMVRMGDGSELYFHRSIKQYGDNQFIEPIIADFWRERWFRYWFFLRPWLLLAALPGFVFIVAYALLWVADGFGSAG
jgi:hypothetical protein